MPSPTDERADALARAVSVPEIADMRRAPASFTFARIVANLEAALQPARAPGRLGPVEDEAVLFRANPSMGFPAEDVHAVRLDAPPGTPWQAQVIVNFLGLYGPSSPMPAFWTERVVQDLDGSANLRDLLDVFGHPLIALSYRIWQHYRLHLQLTPRAFGQLGVVGRALIGLSPGGQSSLETARLLPLAGLLAQYGRSAEILRAAIGIYFSIEVAVEEWVPCWSSIPVPQQFRLGAPAALLGDGVLGEQVREVAGAIRVQLGPLPRERFDDFLPNGRQRDALRELVQLVLRDPIDCFVDLELASGEPGGLVLGETRLGWTSWPTDPSAPRRCDTGVLHA